MQVMISQLASQISDSPSDPKAGCFHLGDVQDR